MVPDIPIPDQTVPDQIVPDTFINPDQALPTTKELVAWYQFEATSGQVVDSSGKGNHGTAYGGVTRGVNGRIGKAVQLDGTNDYVSAPHKSSLNFGTGGFTYEFWIKTTQTVSTGGYKMLLIKGVYTDSKRSLVKLLPGGTIAFAGNTPTGFAVTGTKIVNDGKWHHVAVTRDATMITLYIDGNKDASKTGPTGSADNGSGLYLGKYGTGPGAWFKGMLDEVKIYNYARTAAQVASDATIGVWKTTKALPVPVATHAVVSYKDYIYVIGGTTKTGSPPSGNSDVYYAKVSSSGTISSWSKTSSPGGNWHNLDAAVHGNVIFAAGGSNGYGALSKVMYSEINTSTGALGTWKSGQSLPSAQENAALAAYNGYLYAIGGRDASSTKLKKCLYAAIGSGGILGSWKSCTSLPAVTSGHQHGAVTYNGRMYVFGGINLGTKDIYWTDVASSGALGTWKTSQVSFYTLSGVVLQSGGKIFSIGGSGATAPHANVHYTDIASSGSPGAWASFSSLPKAKTSHDGAVVKNHLLIIGGTEPGMAGYSGTTTVYSAKAFQWEIFDDMEDSKVDTKKWTLAEDYNSEHGKSPSPGFTEQSGKIGVHSSFSYSNDKAWVRFNTLDSTTKKPSFDFRKTSKILIDSFIKLTYKNSCFGSGYGHYYLIDEHKNKVKLYEYKATGNGDNKDEAIFTLDLSTTGSVMVYRDGVLKGTVSTSTLTASDKWTLEFYAYIASGSGCSNSAYMDIWLDEIRYLP